MDTILTTRFKFASTEFFEKIAQKRDFLDFWRFSRKFTEASFCSNRSRVGAKSSLDTNEASPKTWLYSEKAWTGGFNFASTEFWRKFTEIWRNPHISRFLLIFQIFLQTFIEASFCSNRSRVGAKSSLDTNEPSPKTWQYSEQAWTGRFKFASTEFWKKFTQKRIFAIFLHIWGNTKNNLDTSRAPETIRKWHPEVVRHSQITLQACEKDSAAFWGR
jgi:hypothetical protein